MGENKKLIIFGRQGSGKGTQCAKIVEALGVIHLSTGDILRSNIENQTELGKKVEPLLAAGELVDDATILEIVADRLHQDDVVAQGFILDGFPRTIDQAKGLLDILGTDGIDKAINLDVSIEEVTERILKRGRNDDVADAIKTRLELYESQTVPVIQYFDELGYVETVDGLGEESEVIERILKALQ